MPDFIVVGNGMAGSLLAYRLDQAGQQVLLVGSPDLPGASRVAAGLCNPITGRRMIKTWLADIIFPYLHEFYPALERHLGVSVFYPRPVYRPFVSEKAQKKWLKENDREAYADFVDFHAESLSLDGVQDPWGGLLVKQGGFVDTNTLLDALQRYFEEKSAYQATNFDEAELELLPDGLNWRGIRAKKLIFARGAADRHSPFWQHLPFDVVKGEILDIAFEPPATEAYVLNQGCWVLQHPDGTFKVGATYDRSDLSTQPTTAGRENIEQRLKRLVNWSYQVRGQRAGVRPATRDHRPLTDLHTEHRQLAIFNGFGSKGCTLMPYLSALFRDFLLEGKPLPESVRLGGRLAE